MKFVFFLRTRLLFNTFYCFCMFVTNTSYILGAYISKSKRCYNAKPLAYNFHLKTKISVDFHICISVTLMYGPEWNASGICVNDNNALDC